MATGLISSLTDPQVLISEGVPAILGLTSGVIASASASASLIASTAEAAAIAQLQTTYDALTGYAWGLFPNTQQTTSTLAAIEQSLGLQQATALFPDSVVMELNVSPSRTVSNAPIEAGSFVSYNKVAEPTRFELVLSFSGTIRSKQKSLQALEALENSTTLVSIRMPEKTYSNLNVISNPINRNARLTADLIIVRVILQEILVFAKTTVTNTKSGTSVSVSDQGSKQAQDADTATAATISSGTLS